MDDDLREKLSRMTVKNGCTLNEERIAQDKMARYVRSLNWTNPNRIDKIGERIPREEQRFLDEWYKLKMANRKKWKVL